VISKKEFINKILTMEYPILEEHASDTTLISCYLTVKCSINFSNYLILSAVRLTNAEYLANSLGNYYKREIKMKQKYEKWLYDVCGNYCVTRIKIISNNI